MYNFMVSYFLRINIMKHITHVSRAKQTRANGMNSETWRCASVETMMRKYEMP